MWRGDRETATGLLACAFVTGDHRSVLCWAFAVTRKGRSSAHLFAGALIWRTLGRHSRMGLRRVRSGWRWRRASGK